MGIVGRLDQYASILAGEFDDYSMSENLIAFSGIPSSNWTSFNSAVLTNNSSTSPDGIVDATQIAGTAQIGSGCFVLVSLTSGTEYTYSLFVKAVSGSNTIYFGSDTGTGATVQVNTSTGVVSNNSGSTTNITSRFYRNGWYRVSFTFTASVTANHSFVIYNLTANVNTWLAWGAQVETGTVVTDYTPTSGTAKTRVFPSATNTNITGLSSYFSSGFSENVGAATTTLTANVFLPYDLVYDDFGGTLFGAGQGRYKRQNTDKSVIVYNEIDEITDFRDIVRTGLVLDLDAAQPLSYKGTGTVWTDLSSNGNNGTLTNGPTYSTINGGIIDFDGTDDYATINNLNNLNTQYASSEVWVKLDSPNNGVVQRILDRSNTSVGTFSIVKTAINRITVNTRDSVDNVFPLQLNTLPSTNWVQIVHTYDGTTISAYVNGAFDISSTSLPGTLNTGGTLTIRISSNSVTPGTQIMDGSIAVVRLYNRALTATEVLQNYNALKHRFGL